MNLTDVSSLQLRRALEIKEQIEKLESELNSILSGGQTASRQSTTASIPSRGGRRTMSAAARARIAAAQRARWAKVKGTTQNGASRPKRKMSAAGRARIVAATKARWARFHAARA
jgi:hypothetical protein